MAELTAMMNITKEMKKSCYLLVLNLPRNALRIYV